MINKKVSELSLEEKMGMDDQVETLIAKREIDLTRYLE